MDCRISEVIVAPQSLPLLVDECLQAYDSVGEELAWVIGSFSLGESEVADGGGVLVVEILSGDRAKGYGSFGVLVFLAVSPNVHAGGISPLANQT